MKKILFIGSFLSKNKGTKGIAEKIQIKFKNEFNIILVSDKENQLLRLVHILIASLFYDYSIIHIDVYSGKARIYARLAAFIAKLKNKKIIFNLRGGKLTEIYENNSTKLNFLKNSHKIVSPSKFLIHYFDKYNIKIDYLPNYIDNEFFPYKRFKVKKYSILWVRAFNDIYQPELAVKIIDKLKDIYPKVHLTMIGPDKGYQQSTENLISKLNLEKYISIIGKIPNEELYKYYQSNQVYLNTTVYESFGSAVLEAASCGVPIVSTNAGEIPYIWEHGKEILLCESNEDEFKEHVESIFESEELEKKLSLNARKKSEEFDWKSVKKQWEKLIENI